MLIIYYLIKTNQQI